MQDTRNLHLHVDSSRSSTELCFQRHHTRSTRKWKCQSLSCVYLFVTPWIIACQALSVDFSRQEYWSGQPFASSGDLPNSGIKPGSSVLQADSVLYELPGKPSTYRESRKTLYSFTLFTSFQYYVKVSQYTTSKMINKLFKNLSLYTHRLKHISCFTLLPYYPLWCSNCSSRSLFKLSSESF